MQLTRIVVVDGLNVIARKHVVVGGSFLGQFDRRLQPKSKIT